MGLDISSRHTSNPSAPAAGFSTLYPFGASDAATVYRFIRADGSIANIATLEASAQTFTGSLTVGGLITANTGLTVASGQSLTLTGATVAGAPTWSSSQAITLSTAAQPNVTSLGTLTGLTVSGSTILGDTSGDLVTIYGQTLIGHTASVGVNPNILQIKAAGSFGAALGLVSSNNEVAGSLRISSSASNSVVLQIDPDNLRASSGFSLSIDATEMFSIASTGAASFGSNSLTAGAGSFTTGAFSSGAAVGGATAGTGGIAFPATAVAVADVNTLDDYEEGTWTPTIWDAATGGNQGSGSFSGTYTKIGRLVILDGTLADPVTAGMTAGNVLYVRGLPFTNAAIARVGFAQPRKVNFTNMINAYLAASVDYVSFDDLIDSAYSVTIKVSDFPSGDCTMRFQIIYTV